MERVRPHIGAEPLELENGTVRAGNVVTDMNTGRPHYEVVDTQQGGGESWPDGLIVQSATDPDGLSFVEAEEFNEWIGSPRYSI